MAGSIVVAFYSNTIGTTGQSPINLTTQGPTDWAHWGDSSASLTPTNTKSGGGSQISAAGSIVTWQASDDRLVSWTDGTPTASASNIQNRLLCASSSNQSIAVTYPASASAYQVWFHGGCLDGAAKITIHLSDGSAPDVVYTTPVIWNNTKQDIDLKVNYNANGAATLTITLTNISTDPALNTYMYLVGATLNTSPSDLSVTACNVDLQQAMLETPRSQPAIIDLQQGMLESPYTQPVNIDLQQAVIELPFTMPSGAGPSEGFSFYSTTFYLWQIQSLPDQLYNWRSQFISHGLKGYQHVGPILASYVASDTVTLSFSVFDGTAPANITLPSTAGQIQRSLLIPTFNKFRLIRYICSSPSPFQILLQDWLVKVGEWGRPGDYVSYRLLGEG